MKTIVMAHAFYQKFGGEDQVFLAEAALLKRHGHRVERFTVHNDEIEGSSNAALVAATFWNRATARRLDRLLRETGAQIVHFHNTFPLMSPSVYYAARARGVAIVQTLHNFRLACLQGFFLRDGQICQDCLGRTFRYPAVLHGCYRGSRKASAVAAAMFQSHAAIGTWRCLPDVYVALSEFARAKFIESGLPPDRLSVKPNFVAPDPGMGDGSGNYALFVGRLAPEKGVDTLLKAWHAHRPIMPLRIVGSGPLEAEVAAAAAADPGIAHDGFRQRDEVLDLIGRAAMVIVPSRGLEPFGLVAIEALARGTPVVAARVGSLPGLVDDGRTGRLFAPGDAADLAAQVGWVWQNRWSLRAPARAAYLGSYTAEANYRTLTAIYQRALDHREPAHQLNAFEAAS